MVGLVIALIVGIPALAVAALIRAWRRTMHPAAPVAPYVPPLRGSAPGPGPGSPPGGDPAGDREPRVGPRPAGSGAIALPVPGDGEPIAS